MKHPPNGFVNKRVLKLNVGFLLNESLGTSRTVDFAVPPLAVSADLHLDYLQGTLRLSRTREGILVQGTLQAAVQGECSRCLTTTDVPLTLDLEELFSTSANHSTFTIGEDAILDLTPLVREEAIVSIPVAPLCKPDCAGLCPSCGQNLNLGSCDCPTDDIDPRFAILLQLKNQE